MNNDDLMSIPESIGITGMGMVTSLGLSARASCAAARANITRLKELEILNFVGSDLYGGEPVTGHEVPSIADGCVGRAKVLTLGQYALEDLLANQPAVSGDVGLYINLSDQYVADRFDQIERQAMERAESLDEDGPPGTFPWDDAESDASTSLLESWRSDCVGLGEALVAACRSPISVDESRLYFHGHTGFVHALRDAVSNLAEGKHDRCIVGAIDSCIEPRFLIAATSLGLVKTSNNSIGFHPGEAAAFLLIERCTTTSDRARVLAHVSSMAIGADEDDRFAEQTTKGIGLTHTIDSALSSLPHGQAVCTIVADLNGDDYRAMDWGYAQERMLRKYGLEGTVLSIPALNFGEVGAATGAVASCFVLRTIGRNGMPHGTALIWLTSEDGTKAALTLRPVKC